MDWATFLEWFLKALVLILLLTGGFAYTTLYERRLLARMQVRIGPNRAGPQGTAAADRRRDQADLQRAAHPGRRR